MSYSNGFKKGYKNGYNDAFKMATSKLDYSIEFAEIIRKNQLKIINKELNEKKKSHSTPEPSCCYSEPWQGECGSNAILDNGQCENHQKKCSCGKMATHGCSHAGQFVCGRPLCDDCICKH